MGCIHSNREIVIQSTPSGQEATGQEATGQEATGKEADQQNATTTSKKRNVVQTPPVYMNLSTRRQLEIAVKYDRAKNSANWAPSEISRVEPPAQFQLVPVLKEGATPALPPLCAMKGYPMFDPHEDEHTYGHIDAHARQVAAITFGSFRQLLYALIYHRNIKDDIERVRSLFIFFGNTNFFKFEFKTVAPDSIEDRLLGIIPDNGNEEVVNSEVIADLFVEFCSYSGLHCRKLSGFARSASFTPGYRFMGNRDKKGHVWNAVLVHNQWRLLDVMWGGSYINEETYRQKTEFESNGFYFLPDPMAFALDHHCTELQWALLPDPRLGLEAGNAPRTLREFEDDPRRPGFYVFRCSQVAPTDAETVLTTFLEAEFIIRFRDERIAHQHSFSYTIIAGDASDVIQGYKLHQWGAIYREKNELRLRVRPPTRSIYCVSLSGRWIEDEEAGKGKDAGVKRVKSLEIAKWKVDARELGAQSRSTSEGRTDAARLGARFPESNGLEYGPSLLAIRKGVRSNLNDGVIRTDTGICELRLDCNEAMQSCSATLTSLVDGAARDFSQYVLFRKCANALLVSVHVPAAGEYCLSLFGRERKEDKSADVEVEGSPCLWTYLIVSAGVSPTAAMLVSHEKHMYGPSQRAISRGVRANVSDSVILVENGTCDIRLDCKQLLWGSATLKGFAGGSEFDATKYVMFRSFDEALVATIHVPAAGTYCLTFFDDERTLDNSSSAYLWTFMIISKSHSPTSGLLTRHEKNTYGNWSTLSAVGLRPNFNGDPLIKTQEREHVLRFSYTNPMELSFNFACTQFSLDNPSVQLDGYIIWQTLENDKKIEITLRFPQNGIYSFELFGAPEIENKKPLPLLATYIFENSFGPGLINRFPVKVPALGTRKLPKFLSLKTDYSTPVLITDTGIVKINIASRISLEINAELLTSEKNKTKKFEENWILEEHQDNDITLKINCPSCDEFGLSVSGRQTGDQSSSFDLYGCYLIKGINNGYKRWQLSPFPKQFSNWFTEKCTLIEPMEGILSSKNFPNGWVSFRVRVPTASKVAVIVNDESNYRYMSNIDGEWFVQLYLPKYFENRNNNAKLTLTVSAILPSQKSNPKSNPDKSYWELLEYSLEGSQL